MYTDMFILVTIMLFFIILLTVLVYWHAKKYAFICPRCSLEFTLTPLKNLVSLNGLSHKYVKCPNCDKHYWVEVVKR